MTSTAVAIEIVAALRSPARRAESCRVARAGRPPPRAVGRAARVPGRKRWSARAKPLCGTDPPESERQRVVPLLAPHAGDKGKNKGAHRGPGGAARRSRGRPGDPPRENSG